MYDNLTPAQASVLEPPYANRLDRPNIVIRSNDNDDDDLDDDDGEKTQKHDTQQVFAVEITTRNERKKNHDQEVFGTKYFQKNQYRPPWAAIYWFDAHTIHAADAQNARRVQFNMQEK